MDEQAPTNLERWQKVFTEIVDLTGSNSTGYVLVEIKDVPHAIWETLPGTIHEFQNQNPKYTKEFKPILNLTLKVGCRCTSHANPDNSNTLKDTPPKELTPQEKQALKQFFDAFEYP